jgi:1-acyl-sn-glycerol-3-phosphate acyltransferase
VNVRSLLERGELCLIFPEGMAAMSKPRDARYRLGGWHVGHAELALRHGATIVPVAVIGSEEQWPTVARVRALRPFGAPYLPVMATPFPLPVHYHLHYGEPIDLRARFGSSELSTALIDEGASVTREALQTLIDRGVQERGGVFR